MTPWNKNKKGMRLSPKSEFKKGSVPWNKGERFEAVSGSKNHLWKGGITKLVDRIRKTPEYFEWRVNVFKRDSFSCMMPLCINRAKEFNAHHIKDFSSIVEENNISTLDQAIKCAELWDTNNGITLCKKCHSRIRQHEKEYYTIFTNLIKLYDK